MELDKLKDLPEELRDEITKELKEKEEIISKYNSLLSDAKRLESALDQLAVQYGRIYATLLVAQAKE